MECGGLAPLCFGVRRPGAALFWSAAAWRRFLLQYHHLAPLSFRMSKRRRVAALQKS